MIEQIIIAVFGVGATWLSQDPRRQRQRWACVLGLAAQPAWFWMAWKAEQWGVIVLVFLYGWCWLRGLYHHWLRPA